MQNIKHFLVLSIVITLAACQIPSRYIASNNDDGFWNINPKRTIEEVHPQSESEQVAKLANPRIVVADYDLIRRDFPAMAAKTNDEIDRWILDQVGYVSIPQAEQTVVNTRIQTTGQTRTGYRPPKYGRAMVFDMAHPDSGDHLGIIDVKGTGALNPGQRDHGNGVATLGESMREFIYENMMRRVLKDSDLENKTVGSYAVIDPGFDVVHADGSTSPAGYYLRQGHDRIPIEQHPGAWLPESDRMAIQKVFHTYGIDPNRNIQGTYDHHLFDFGHYIVRDDLDTIDPQKAIPFTQWGYDKNIRADSGDRWFYSKKDHPWNWSHEFADNWRKGHANRDGAWMHFLNMVAPVEQKLRTGVGGMSCQQLMNHLVH